jgi:AAA15 family ATPase/GTPase
MIQELRFKNFLSFREESTFSFEADKSTEMEDVQVVTMPDGVRLLKFAMVYGANASGKSNLLEAFDFLRHFWFYRTKDSDEGTNVSPFLLDKETPSQPSIFDIKFYVDGSKYWYHLEVDKNAVLEERLYLYKSVQPTLLFKRELENGISKLSFNPAVVKVSSVGQEKLEVECLKNISFFAAKGNANIALGEIDKVREWIKGKILPEILPETHMFEYAERKLFDNDKLKLHILDFIHKADFNITDIRSEKSKQQISAGVMKIIMESSTLPDSEKEKIKQDGSFDTIKTTFIHKVNNGRCDEFYPLSPEQQSVGTRRLFGVESAIYDAISNSSFLTIDELESSLHPDLMEFVIEKFLQHKESHSQLLISTHCLDLLGLIGDLVRKDSVWFTEKEDSGNTDLYSLIEFSGINRMASILKAYKNGKFGALPRLKE